MFVLLFLRILTMFALHQRRKFRPADRAADMVFKPLS
jgi:hypothetical protein